MRATCAYFFFSSRRRHTRLQGDWSSDVCSSNLYPRGCMISTNILTEGWSDEKPNFADGGRARHRDAGADGLAHPLPIRARQRDERRSLRAPRGSMDGSGHAPELQRGLIRPEAVWGARGGREGGGRTESAGLRLVKTRRH